MRIAVISDTHGLLRPEVMERLRDCGTILHAGDLGTASVMKRLQDAAPLYAVRGNVDGAWAGSLPVRLDFTLAGLRVFITHKKKDLPADLTPYGLVLYGHSHQYACERQGCTWLLNPGSCGPRRFFLPVTMALLEVEDNAVKSVERIGINDESVLQPPVHLDMKKTVELVMRETARGRSPSEIAGHLGIDQALAEQIARLYVTHPGVTADGIMGKMGL